MGAYTKIQWATHTFNPFVGCSKVSAACDHCYAETWARRSGQEGLWAGERRRTKPTVWNQPRKWNALAEREGRRDRVFCASLADVFDEAIEPHWREDLWALIRETPHLDWLLLTKRPHLIRRMLPHDWGQGYAHVWLGTTVESQEVARVRIPELLIVPARVRFLSCEPLLGPLDLTAVQMGDGEGNALKPEMWEDEIARWRGTSPAWEEEFMDWYGCLPSACSGPMYQAIDWVIVGGESGAHFRAMDLAWARALRDQCARHDVAFFMKQTSGATKGSMPPIPDDLMIRDLPRV